MYRNLVTGLALLICWQVVEAQSLPNDELINRIKLNTALFAQLDQGANLPERAHSQGKDIFVNRVNNETATLCDACSPEDPTNDPEVKRAASESDLIAVGHVTRNISALTANEAFVFTDSEFVLDEVWKSRHESKVFMPKDEITVVTPGGTVMSDGHKIRAALSNHAQLMVGHSYLLFLKYLPENRSYTVVSLSGFDVTNEKVVSLRTSVPSPAKELLGDKINYLQALHSSTARAMGEEKK